MHQRDRAGFGRRLRYSKNNDEEVCDDEVEEVPVRHSEELIGRAKCQGARKFGIMIN